MHRTPLDLRDKTMADLQELDRMYGTWLDGLTPEQAKHDERRAYLIDRRQIRAEMQTRRDNEALSAYLQSSISGRYVGGL